VEIQFSDFITCAFDQLVTVAAKNHYRWGGTTPIVVRAPCGGNIHGGPFHSQCIEGYFFNVPGLKIVFPSTAYDAKGLLKSAIRDNDPVIYCEHKYLYRRIKDFVPEEDYTVPIGKARIALEGKDISIITYGAMVHAAFEAAQLLKEKEISIEIIDLRTILPLDKKSIFDTVKKTNKVIILHEQTKTGGVGAEVSALIEYCFEYLMPPLFVLLPRYACTYSLR
jgi:2-oxoisovalerate dehydrogenase E1 component beta subunit